MKSGRRRKPITTAEGNDEVIFDVKEKENGQVSARPKFTGKSKKIDISSGV